MNIPFIDNENLVRSSIFLPDSVARFIKSEAKKRKTTKGTIVALAIRELEKAELRKQMEVYYANPENDKYEEIMAEKWFSGVLSSKT